MSITLTYGRIKPQNGDLGDTIYDALENNIDLDDAHSHNGVNSPVLGATALAATTQAIAAASWVALGGGMYRQLVTLPGLLTYDAIVIEFRNAAGERMYLHHIKNAANSYYVYINDNTLTITAFYV